MKKFVLGFVFNTDFTQVLLIHKNRPEWQKGMMNGLGGKIEEGETSIDAMVREIREECGLVTGADEWTYSGQIYSDTFVMDVFGLIHEESMGEAESLIDEEIEWCTIDPLPKNVIHNLPWLIPATIDKMKHDDFESFKVKYHK